MTRSRQIIVRRGVGQFLLCALKSDLELLMAPLIVLCAAFSSLLRAGSPPRESTCEATEVAVWIQTT